MKIPHFIHQYKQIIMNEKYSLTLDEIAKSYFAQGLYEFLCVLGQGSYGKVYKIQDKSTKVNLAAKLVSKSTFGETTFWPLLQHPNVLELIQFLSETNEPPYFEAFLMPYVGDDLFHILYERVPRFHDCNQAFERKKNYSIDVLKGLEYIHSRNLCHLDIKEENILISEKTDSAIICDFSTLTNYQDVKRSKFGLHLPSLPPEVAMATNDCFDGFQAEMWTYGILVLQIFTKAYIFRTLSNRNDLDYSKEILPLVLKATKKAKKDFYDLHQRCSLSNECVSLLFDFINKFLKVDPRERPSASQALLDPFFVFKDSKRGKKRSCPPNFQIEDAAALLESLNIDEGQRVNQQIKNASDMSTKDSSITMQDGVDCKHIESTGCSKEFSCTRTFRTIKTKYNLRRKDKINNQEIRDEGFHKTNYKNEKLNIKYEQMLSTSIDSIDQCISMNTVENEKKEPNLTQGHTFSSLFSNIQVGLSHKTKRRKGDADNHHLHPTLTTHSTKFSSIDMNEDNKKNFVYKFFGRGKPQVVTRARKQWIASLWKKYKLRQRSRRISKISLLRDMDVGSREVSNVLYEEKNDLKWKKSKKFKKRH